MPQPPTGAFISLETVASITNRRLHSLGSKGLATRTNLYKLGRLGVSFFNYLTVSCLFQEAIRNSLCEFLPMTPVCIHLH